MYSKRASAAEIVKFDVDKARNIRDKLRDTENALFERLWANLVNRIRIQARRSWELRYCVPTYTAGLPRYDPIMVARRLRVRLRNRGFTVDPYSGENESPVVSISWRRVAPGSDPGALGPRGALASSHTMRNTQSLARQVDINKQCGFA